MSKYIISMAVSVESLWLKKSSQFCLILLRLLTSLPSYNRDWTSSLSTKRIIIVLRNRLRQCRRPSIYSQLFVRIHGRSHYEIWAEQRMFTTWSSVMSWCRLRRVGRASAECLRRCREPIDLRGRDDVESESAVADTSCRPTQSATMARLRGQY